MTPLPRALDLAGTFVFALSGAMAGGKHRLDLFDAAGLGLFALTGAEKVPAHGLNPVMATLLGRLTGIGAGVARGMLLAEIPVVLRVDVCAVAAASGGRRGQAATRAG